MDQQVYYHSKRKLTCDRSCIGSILIGNDFCGSGFIMHNERLIVTSAHNLDPIDGPIKYCTASDDEGKNVKIYKLNKVKILREYDLALLESQENISEFSFSIASEFNVCIDDTIYYYGFDKKNEENQKLIRDKNGHPLDKPQGRHIYQSKISSIAKTKIEGGPIIDYIEYGGYAVPGFSGGVTMNLKGEAIAINTVAWLGQGFRDRSYFVVNKAFSLQPLRQILESLFASKNSV